jgi:hypothetical protein
MTRNLDGTRDPPLPVWAGWRAHGVWRRGPSRGMCLRRDCGGARLLVDHLPVFSAIRAADLRDLAALEDLPAFEAELDVTREAVLRDVAESCQENCLIDLGERRWVHATNFSRGRESVLYPTCGMRRKWYA